MSARWGLHVRWWGRTLYVPNRHEVWPVHDAEVLAAQPGVRHSLVDPHAYTANNITGFLNVTAGAGSVVPDRAAASRAPVGGRSRRHPSGPGGVYRLGSVACHGN